MWLGGLVSAFWLSLFSGWAAAAADEARLLEMGTLFRDHMVLQRDMAVPVWGQAGKGAKVRVEFAGQQKTTTADEGGKWMLRLDPLPASSEGRTMTITASGSATDKLTLSDVLVGEVWICSGQSNMDWTVSALKGRYDEEIAAADDPALHLAMVEPLYAARPLETTGASWHPCTPERATEFSAVALFFGRKLRQELKVPVGLVESARGGSPVECWMSEEALRRDFPEFNAKLDTFADVVEKSGGVFKLRKESKQYGIIQRTPTVFYNAHIHPLIPFGMRGVIWYQGESGEFPFYYVQLAPCTYEGDSGALLREAQMKSLSVPNTGMAVIMDVGEEKNIHPIEKKPVGERLALLALAKTYGRKDLVCSGPIYKGCSIEGSSMRIRFHHAGSGLASRDGKPLTHFTIAGADRHFVEAEAVIEGDTVVVSSPQVAKPVALRFAFGSADIPNLMNKEGLPASSFRTDNDAQQK